MPQLSHRAVGERRLTSSLSIGAEGFVPFKELFLDQSVRSFSVVFVLHMARAFATAAATSAALLVFLKGNFKFDESFLRVLDLKWGQSLFRS